MGEIKGWEDLDKPRWKGGGQTDARQWKTSSTTAISACPGGGRRRRKRKRKRKRKADGTEAVFRGGLERGVAAEDSVAFRGRAREGRVGGRIPISLFLITEDLLVTISTYLLYILRGAVD